MIFSVLQVWKLPLRQSWQHSCLDLLESACHRCGFIVGGVSGTGLSRSVALWFLAESTVEALPESRTVLVSLETRSSVLYITPIQSGRVVASRG